MGLFFLFLSLLFDWEVSFGGCDLGCQATLGEVNNAAALCDSQIIATMPHGYFFDHVSSLPAISWWPGAITDACICQQFISILRLLGVIEILVHIGVL